MESNCISYLKKNLAKVNKSIRQDENKTKNQVPISRKILPSLKTRENNKTHFRSNTSATCQPSLSSSPCKISPKLNPIPNDKLLMQNDFGSSSSLPMKPNACNSVSPKKQGPSRYVPVSQLRPQKKKPRLYEAIKAFSNDFQYVLEKRSEKANDCRNFDTPDYYESIPRDVFTWKEALINLELIDN